MKSWPEKERIETLRGGAAPPPHKQVKVCGGEGRRGPVKSFLPFLPLSLFLVGVGGRKENKEKVTAFGWVAGKKFECEGGAGGKQAAL